MAVDEPRDRAEARAVEVLHLALEPAEIAHAARGRDPPALAEDERVLEHLDAAERVASERRAGPRRGRELPEIANQEPRGRSRLGSGHVPAEGDEGRSRPCSSAAAIASG